MFRFQEIDRLLRPSREPIRTTWCSLASRARTRGRATSTRKPLSHAAALRSEGGIEATSIDLRDFDAAVQSADDFPMCSRIAVRIGGAELFPQNLLQVRQSPLQGTQRPARRESRGGQA